MKPIQKREILKAISINLAKFNPRFSGKFLCPTCLEVIDINDVDKISEAHILPKAAVTGESLTTWLCTKCNNTFGSRFDRWFGEYLNYQQDGSLFSDKITKGKLTFNNIEFNGLITKENDDICFIMTKFNSPDTIKQIKEEALSVSQKRLSIDIPLLSKSIEVDVGLLTAAYLYGFTIFGYSWVLQKRFEKIRNVILGRTQICDVVGSFHISKIKSEVIGNSHWFGIGLVNEEFIPCVRILGNIVYFTPCYNQGVILQTIQSPKEFSHDLKIFNNISNRQYQRPLIYSINDKIIIFPDETHFGDIIPDFVILTNSKSWETNILTQKIDYSNPPKVGMDDTIYKVEIPD